MSHSVSRCYSIVVVMVFIYGESLPGQNVCPLCELLSW